MTMAYTGVPTVTDPNVIAQNALAYLADNIPGWSPSDQDLETWAILAFAFMLAQSRDVASIVPDDIYSNWGKTILGLQPILAAPATIVGTFTAIDNQGYTLPAGTQIGWAVTGDNIIPFTLDADCTVPPLSTVSPQFSATAVTPGSAANGLGPGAMVLIDTYAFVQSITATATSANGVDGETSAAYLNRVVAASQLQSPRPILPPDFAALATSIAGVYRALAINGYNPGDGTSGNVKMVAVAVVDENGAVLSGGIKTAVQTLLQSMREINFVVNVMDPTYTALTVVYEIHVPTGYDPAATLTAVNNALISALSAASWGGGNLIPPSWDPNATTVRYLQVARIIEDVAGVDHIIAGTLTVNGGTADVVLAGQAPLPTLDLAHITGTHD